MAGYTRNDTGNNIADGNVINAADLDGEFDAVETAFNSAGGHKHDGTSAEGAAIEKIGPAQDGLMDATAFYPKADGTYDLGKTGAEWQDLYIDGTAYLDAASVTGDVTFGDNNKAVFGAGSDLEIYHDGSHSYIDESGGTGNLRIRATNLVLQSVGEEDYATFVANGAATLFYDNAEKISTTATGIDVTGIVDASDLVRFGVNNSEIANNYVRFKPTGAAYIDHSTVGQEINFRLSNASSLDKTVMTLSSAGNVGIGVVSPSAKLHVDNGSGSALYVGLANNIYSRGAEHIWQSLNNASEYMRIDASGHAIIPAGVTLGTAAGVYSANNTLDDYEQGSYTVQLFDASSGGNASSSSVTGYYTKIGNQVTVRFDALNNINTTGMTGANELHFSLPFSASSTGRSAGSVVSDTLTFDSGATMVTPQVLDSASRGQFRTTGSAVTDKVTQVQDINSGATDIHTFTLTYFTA